MESWIRKKFREAYKKLHHLATEVSKREFGIGNLTKKIYKRHMAFVDEEDLQHYLEVETPFYISHSVAYYKKPSATPMEAKGWEGADLVFDLDAESHSKEAINKVKEDLINLIDLVNDYLDAKDTLIVFSGNRGFHFHIRDKRFRKLGTDERLKLIEFLKGEKFDHKKLFDVYNRFNLDSEVLLGPKPSDLGFGGLFARETINLLNKEPQKLHRYFKEKENRERFIKGIKEGNWNRYDKRRVKNLMDRLDVVAKRVHIFSLSIDSGVTQDITKLIRVPGSLHGSTGFWVMPIKKSRIEEFDPFYDPVVIDEEPVKVKMIQSVFINIKDFKGKLKKEEIVKVPSYVGVYLILKNYSLLLDG